MPDGCRLAARAWLPDGCEEKPVPAVFEYIPYRRRDITRTRDEPIHRYFAGNGLASLRVDMRGSGIPTVSCATSTRSRNNWMRSR